MSYDDVWDQIEKAKAKAAEKEAAKPMLLDTDFEPRKVVRTNKKAKYFGTGEKTVREEMTVYEFELQKEGQKHRFEVVRYDVCVCLWWVGVCICECLCGVPVCACVSPLLLYSRERTQTQTHTALERDGAASRPRARDQNRQVGVPSRAHLRWLWLRN